MSRFPHPRAQATVELMHWTKEGLQCRDSILRDGFVEYQASFNPTQADTQTDAIP
jgi:hypothetical protein